MKWNQIKLIQNENQRQLRWQMNTATKPQQNMYERVHGWYVIKKDTLINIRFCIYEKNNKNKNER